MNEESIKVGDRFRFDLKTSGDKDLADTLTADGYAHGTEIEVTNILPTPWSTDDLLVEFYPAIGPHAVSHAGLTWFAEATDSGVLVFLGNKGPEPLNNDGRETCYWGCGPTTPISARKHYCKVCGK